MEIHHAIWRVQNGLSYCRQSIYAFRLLLVQWRAEFRGIGDTGNVGVCLLLRVSAVVMALLLLIAGDVERNPGPTVKEGIVIVITILSSPVSKVTFEVVTYMSLVCTMQKDFDELDIGVANHLTAYFRLLDFQCFKYYKMVAIPHEKVLILLILISF